MNLYLSQYAEKELRTAQSALDRHTESSATGRCLSCGEIGPCQQRLAALRIFGRYGRLPHRLPGASRPDMITATGSWRWFG